MLMFLHHCRYLIELVLPQSTWYGRQWLHKQGSDPVVVPTCCYNPPSSHAHTLRFPYVVSSSVSFWCLFPFVTSLVFPFISQLLLFPFGTSIYLFSFLFVSSWFLFLSLSFTSPSLKLSYLPYIPPSLFAFLHIFVSLALSTHFLVLSILFISQSYACWLSFYFSSLSFASYLQTPPELSSYDNLAINR